MHFFRVGGSPSKKLAGTAVDEIMTIGGWKTESVAKYYIGVTSSGKVLGSRRKRSQSCASGCELPLSPELNISQRVRERIHQNAKNVWVRQPHA